MERPVTDLETLGERTAGALDSHATDRDRAIQRARRGFLEAALTPAGNRRVVGRGWMVAVAAIAAAAALAVWIRLPPSSLAFTAGGEKGVLESWVAAPESAPVPLRFSDGSVFSVEASSRARVVAVEAHGASVALETGSLRANVVHSGRGAWRVIAGPLTVHVTGTRFAVRWSAATEVFSVSVEQGSVAVSGSVVGAERPVRAGETLRVRVRDRQLELTNAREAQIQASPIAPPVSEQAAPDRVAENQPSALVPPAAPSHARGSKPEASEDWRPFAERGALREAFAAAEASGFEAACQSASAAELLQLGDGARLSGRADRATLALTTLRKKYPSDPRRAAAAFALGKIAFDQTGAFAQAAEWFRTSIREQPNGSLSREAAGRLIEALKRAGDAAGARGAAESYLARYPEGPHADLARTVVR